MRAQRFGINKSQSCKLMLLAGIFVGCAAGAQPYVYATNTLGNAVAVIDSQTYTLIANIVTGNGTSPAQVALSPDGNYVYVSNQAADSVGILSTATNTIVNTVPVGRLPYGLAVTPDSAFVYVANQGSNNVSVIDTAAQTVIATIPVAASPFAVAVMPDGSRVWVASTSSSRISVIDNTTRALVSVLPATNTPVSLAFSPDGLRAYAANEFADMIAVYDTASGSVVTTLPAPGAPTCVALSPDGTRIYVTSADNQALYMIDTATGRTATIAVGSFPDGVTVSSDNTRAWVSNARDYTLSVVDTTQARVISTLYGMAFYPQGLAIAPSAALPVSVTIQPGGVSLIAGQSQQFTAAVEGSSNTEVRWSISPSQVGTITGGLYVAPGAVGSVQTVMVTATSVADSTKAATAAVTLLPVSVSISPPAVTLASLQTQQFNATVLNTANPNVSWSISPGVGTISASGLYSASAAIGTVGTVTVTAASIADPSRFASAIVTLVPPVFTPIRVNAGGPDYTDPQGNLWSADRGYNYGLSYTTTDSIANTSTPVLYQSERFGWGPLYRFLVPNGTYIVNLKFADLKFAEAGLRIFGVKINARTVLSNFDIAELAGGSLAAVDTSFTVTVTEGQIVITFVQMVGTPQVSAIEILQTETPGVRITARR